MRSASATTAIATRERALQWLVGLLTASAIVLSAASAGARSAPESFADLAEQLLPTVVNIATTQRMAEGQDPDVEEFFREFFERRGEQPPQRERRANSLGSGFIIDPSGYIVTNHHVVAEAEEVTVRLHDDTILTAKIIGSDEKTDLALLKVESEKPLPATTWGDSDATRIGDWVIAIGNPFGLGGTVTAGIVSARQRDINAGPYDDFIQSDAAINRGNSGGPMFNLDGEVIGVNTAIFSPSGGSVGIGFAIPASLAHNVIEQLRLTGEVKRGWLGVRIQTVTEELAEGLRLKDAQGALVASATPGGPAEAGGIEQGDVILEFDGRPVPDMRRLPRMVAETPIGEEVDVVVWRKGERKTVKVKIGELTDEAVAAATPDGGPVDQERELSALGLALGTLTPELRARFQLDEDANGVVVTEVVPDSAAAEKGLRPGDVIVEVDQEKVSDAGEVAAHVAKAKEQGYGVVTLLVYRGGEFQWIAVRIEKS
ncbi:MAG: DegQ family serine endoprotease [Kiloniellales bacterium]